MKAVSPFPAHAGDYQEDEFKPIYEEEINEAIARLKIQNR